MRTATRSEPDVRADIEQAFADGDELLLKELQREYRESHFPVIRLSPSPPRLRYEPARSRSTPARPTASPPDDHLRAPVLGELPGSLVVVLSLSAQESIRDTPFDDGLELSGGLFGRTVDGELRIENASVMRDVHRTSSSTYVSRQQIEQMGEHFAAAGWRPCGDWHSHPASMRGDIVSGPSEPDRASWKANAGRYGTPWVGLILSPWRFTEKRGAEWGLDLPRITAWITPPGATTTAPARLVIEREEM